MSTVVIRMKIPTGAEIRAAAKAAVMAVGPAAASTIVLRTRKGLSADGGAFRPYTPGYARLKARSGRNASPPDLTVSGKFLANLKFLRVTDDLRAIIGFEGVHLSRPLRAKGARKRKGAAYANTSVPYEVLVEELDLIRPFFRITREDELQKLAQIFEREFAAQVKRALPK